MGFGLFVEMFMKQLDCNADEIMERRNRSKRILKTVTKGILKDDQGGRVKRRKAGNELLRHMLSSGS